MVDYGARHCMCLSEVASTLRHGLVEAMNIFIMEETFMAMMGSNVISQ